MKAFNSNYKLLDEMYQDDYYPAFLVDKVKDELQKVIALLERDVYKRQMLGCSRWKKFYDSIWRYFYDKNSKTA